MVFPYLHTSYSFSENFEPTRGFFKFARTRLIFVSSENTGELEYSTLEKCLLSLSLT